MKPKTKEIILEAFAGVLVLVGFSIHGWWSPCFLIISSICGSFALHIRLLNHRTHAIKASQARNWASLFFVASLIGASLYWREYKQPKPEPPTPHFELGFSLAGEKGWPLMLTNDIFKFPIKGKMVEFIQKNMTGIVVVPVAAGTSNFTVNFSLENETQHEIEDVGVKLSLRTNLTFVLAPEWVEDTIENNPKHAYFGCFISRVRPSINGIPFIKFGTHDFRITDVDVVANVQNSFPIGAWGLQLACIEMALPGRPFATLGKTDGTDSDGNLRWNILAHFKDETNAAGKHVVQGYGTWKP